MAVGACQMERLISAWELDRQLMISIDHAASLPPVTVASIIKKLEGHVTRKDLADMSFAERLTLRERNILYAWTRQTRANVNDVNVMLTWPTNYNNMKTNGISKIIDDWEIRHLAQKNIAECQLQLQQSLPQRLHPIRVEILLDELIVTEPKLQQQQAMEAELGVAEVHLMMEKVHQL